MAVSGELKMAVIVLRLGHRKERDKRISTHCGLVARAFGADGIIYSGEEDSLLVDSVARAAANWGGKFSVRYSNQWLGEIRRCKKEGWMVAHLTMYGIPFEKKIAQIKSNLFPKGKKTPHNLLVVIGAEKVPGEVYQLADFNLGVTNQPHSEVAALAVFLYELFASRKKSFPGAKVKIIPVAHGKRVERSHEEEI